jgi:hypothetical protein
MMDASDVLVQQLESNVVMLKDWLAGGQAKDYSEYLNLCGEIRGLLVARQNILDLKKKMEHSDDE